MTAINHDTYVADNAGKTNGDSKKKGKGKAAKPGSDGVWRDIHGRNHDGDGYVERIPVDCVPVFAKPGMMAFSTVQCGMLGIIREITEDGAVLEFENGAMVFEPLEMLKLAHVRPQPCMTRKGDNATHVAMVVRPGVKVEYLGVQKKEFATVIKAAPDACILRRDEVDEDDDLPEVFPAPWSMVRVIGETLVEANDTDIGLCGLVRIDDIVRVEGKGGSDDGSTWTSPVHAILQDGAIVDGCGVHDDQFLATWDQIGLDAPTILARINNDAPHRRGADPFYCLALQLGDLSHYIYQICHGEIIGHSFFDQVVAEKEGADARRHLNAAITALHTMSSHYAADWSMRHDKRSSREGGDA